MRAIFALCCLTLGAATTDAFRISSLWSWLTPRSRNADSQRVIWDTSFLVAEHEPIAGLPFDIKLCWNDTRRPALSIENNGTFRLHLSKNWWTPNRHIPKVRFQPVVDEDGCWWAMGKLPSDLATGEYRLILTRRRKRWFSRKYDPSPPFFILSVCEGVGFMTQRERDLFTELNPEKEKCVYDHFVNWHIEEHGREESFNKLLENREFPIDALKDSAHQHTHQSTKDAALVRLAGDGNHAVCRRVLKLGAQLDIAEHEPIKRAAAAGCKDVLALLIDAASSENKADMVRHALLEAAKFDQDQVLAFLYRHFGAWCEPHLHTAISTATRLARLKSLRYLLQLLPMDDRHLQIAALHANLTAIEGNYDVIKALVDSWSASFEDQRVGIFNAGAHGHFLMLWDLMAEAKKSVDFAVYKYLLSFAIDGVFKHRFMDGVSDVDKVDVALLDLIEEFDAVKPWSDPDDDLNSSIYSGSSGSPQAHDAWDEIVSSSDSDMDDTADSAAVAAIDIKHDGTHGGNEHLTIEMFGSMSGADLVCLTMNAHVVRLFLTNQPNTHGRANQVLLCLVTRNAPSALVELALEQGAQVDHEQYAPARIADHHDRMDLIRLFFQYETNHAVRLHMLGMLVAVRPTVEDAAAFILNIVLSISPGSERDRLDLLQQLLSDLEDAHHTIFEAFYSAITLRTTNAGMHQVAVKALCHDEGKAVWSAADFGLYALMFDMLKCVREVADHRVVAIAALRGLSNSFGNEMPFYNYLFSETAEYRTQRGEAQKQLKKLLKWLQKLSERLSSRADQETTTIDFGGHRVTIPFIIDVILSSGVSRALRTYLTIQQPNQPPLVDVLMAVIHYGANEEFTRIVLDADVNLVQHDHLVYRYAVAQNREEAVRLMLEYEGDAAARKELQNIGLVEAARWGYEPLLQFFLSNEFGGRADVHWKDDEALMTAARHGHRFELEALIYAEPDTAIRKGMRDKALVEAACAGQYDSVDALLNTGAASRTDGFAALCGAVRTGDIAIIMRLVDVDLDAVNPKLDRIARLKVAISECSDAASLSNGAVMKRVLGELQQSLSDTDDRP